MVNDFYIRQIFAGNLKRALRQKALTQKELSEKIGHVTQMQVSRWVTCKNPPSWEMLAEICRVLELRPKDLFFEEQQQALFKPVEATDFEDSDIVMFKKFTEFRKMFSRAS